ncbi:DUF4236 domain-containing protein [Bacillus thuringiensis]|uniref:DUF4236 domain-containing protein n=1 Tax=Bacillus cereus group TaxID=86661 RepID=UPI000A3A5582|nr:DUF4236 domain-containing protein [Bacillus thuringiensis]MEB8671402.1 DUF4236 domain-containing protein [Bacillus cereus]MDR5045741.1 DUF4236 domain-containing protein [Bacillus thuringiensis]MEB8860931.1 DUF4236 domain-containing protein [Bacillus cereus]MEB9421416.1 DUF4236 domain-containing protein [Bacillus cereus]MED3352739.1 DUF4236 domain-containing protein [Bacillus thuringiensis]
MGFGFRKSFKIAPGVRVNVGKRGIGVSAGTKGLRYSVHSSGRSQVTAGIPGTGISYTNSLSSGRKYKTSAYQRRNELARQQREIEKMQELERHRLEVEMFENRLQMIHSIHKECDEIVNWEEIQKRQAPFKQGTVGPKEKIANNELDNYKPSFFSKILKQDEKKKQELLNKIEEAKKEDLEDYKSWERMVHVAQKIVNKDIDTYLEVIEEFAPLDDLTEFGSGFEFFVEESNFIEIEFDVHTEHVVPKDMKALTKTGKVSTKVMPKGKYFDIEQDYVCSCVLRIARDMFALLPVEYVYVHALNEQLNTATGYQEKGTILSVKIDKATLNSLQLDSIDCSDSMVNFEHKMKFKKTKGFDFVSKLER